MARGGGPSQSISVWDQLSLSSKFTFVTHNTTSGPSGVDPGFRWRVRPRPLVFLSLYQRPFCSFCTCKKCLYRWVPVTPNGLNPNSQLIRKKSWGLYFYFWCVSLPAGFAYRSIRKTITCFFFFGLTERYLYKLYDQQGAALPCVHLSAFYWGFPSSDSRLQAIFRCIVVRKWGLITGTITAASQVRKFALLPSSVHHITLHIHHLVFLSTADPAFVRGQKFSDDPQEVSRCESREARRFRTPSRTGNRIWTVGSSILCNISYLEFQTQFPISFLLLWEQSPCHIVPSFLLVEIFALCSSLESHVWCWIMNPGSASELLSHLANGSGNLLWTSETITQPF